jgi:hypothetical protein
MRTLASASIDAETGGVSDLLIWYSLFEEAYY